MLLVVGAILAASVVVALGAARTGLPVLVAFLGLGMLLGSDGPGGIEFDDAELAREVGIIGLALILYEGGLQTSWRRLRQVAVPAALLSTVGVVVTAVLTGVAAHVLFDLSWLEAILLGAVVASTDAAAVFATLRSTHIRRRAGADARGGVGRERSDGDRADDRADRMDREAGKLRVRGSRAARRAAARPRSRSSASCSVRSPCGCSPACRTRSERSRRSRRSRRPRSRSEPRTSSAAAASSPSTSSAWPSAARRRATGANSSRSTRGSRSSRRSRCSSSLACSCSRASCRTVAARRARARAAAHVGGPADRSLGLDSLQRLHRARASAARLGRAPRSSPDRARDLRAVLGCRRTRTRSSTRSSSWSSSRRSCRERRSSGSRAVSTCSPSPRRLSRLRSKSPRAASSS